MAQNGKVNPGVVPFKFGWKKNPEPPHVRDRIPASKVREAISTEKHIHDVMDSKDLYRCISCSPINIILWLGVLTCLAAILALYFAMSIPSQRYWLLPAAASLMILLFIFYVLLYVVFARPRAATPCPEAAATNSVTPLLSLRPSPPLPTSAAAA